MYLHYRPTYSRKNIVRVESKIRFWGDSRQVNSYIGAQCPCAAYGYIVCTVPTAESANTNDRKWGFPQFFINKVLAVDTSKKSVTCSYMLVVV